ncbi:MAG: GNAT family N-acetyltransferase [Candidatus Bathyarchaeota archaeon]|nr:GNAT family N-acetyltransferase [Candidatus Bathyarchaeota archaeon]MDW8040996.1 GNAT family N-acetyltransferase [Nitrososphaerota archaeon]
MEGVDGKVKLPVHVREAFKSDRDAVFDFCRHTWSWGDYIPHVWDQWLQEPNGKVFVAVLDGAPVGIQHISIDKPGEAWLSGARTAPRYRRMGVATAITAKCLEYAKSMGVKVVRLATESDNPAAVAAVQKMGFKPIAEFIEMVLEKTFKANSHSSRWADGGNLGDVWLYLQSSEAYRRAAGLYTVLYHWYSLDKTDLERFLDEGKAIIYEGKGNGAVDGLVLVDDAVASEWRENAIQTCYIDGAFEAVSDMADFLVDYCYRQGVEKIYGFTCNYKPLTDALTKHGFKKPEKTVIAFEKHL